MGACATKPGDLKVKGQAPVVVEDAVVTADEKEKAKAGVLPVAAAVEVVDQADVSRRRSLSDLLKRDAEASEGEADHQDQEAEKVVVVADEEPVSAAAAGEETKTMGSPPQAPVQAPVPTTEHDDDAAEELKVKDADDLPRGDDAHAAAEEEKRVDPESVQVVSAAAAADAAAPGSEENEVSAAAAADAVAADADADADADDPQNSEESKVAAGDDGASA